MKLVDIYATYINNYVDKYRKELYKYMINSNKKKDKIIRDYDQLLLNSYLYIEKLLDEEKGNK